MLPVAVITGTNRGIGLGFCKALAKRNIHVIATARDMSKGFYITRQLQEEGLDIRFFPLDLTDRISIQRFLFFLKDNYPCISILVNSAAICLDGQDSQTGKQTMNTNFWSLAYLTLQLVPFMEKAGNARILNITSGDGELCFLSEQLRTTIMECQTLKDLFDTSYNLVDCLTDSSNITCLRGRYLSYDCLAIVISFILFLGAVSVTEHIHGAQPFYRLSKAFVNAFTRILARMITSETNIIVNAVCPGDVDTEMADDHIENLISVDEAVNNMLWLVDLENFSLPRGQFWRGKECIPW
eukprot:jgi/Galph1/5084/GphlegSOOS_G3693.1